MTALTLSRSLMMKPGTLLPLRSEHFVWIETAVIGAWVGGKPFTARALCDDMEAASALGIKRVEMAFWRCTRALAKRGMYGAQPARIGSKGVDMTSSPTSPRFFNFTQPLTAPEDVTLRTVVEHYIASVNVAEKAKSDLRSALRFHFQLSVKGDDRQLLSRCADVSCAMLYDFPQQLYRLATTALPVPVSSKSAMNYRACVRAAMRRAALDRKVPLEFPLFVEDDAWAQWIDEYFPLMREGKTSPKTARRRQGWRDLAQATKKVYGTAITPAQLTREMTEGAEMHVTRVEGRLHARSFIRQALNALAEEHGVGPYAVPTAARAFQVRTPSGLQPAMYLRAKDGTVGGKSWEQFIEIIRDNALPASMLEYLEYYGGYITLSAGDLLAGRARYPKRRSSHQLTVSSLATRAIALRLFLGIAIEKLAMKPAELTPEVAFGTHFEEIAVALIEWWQARRAALPAGAKGTALAGGLKETIISAGMMAYSLYERRRHSKKAEVATRRTEKLVLLDTRREEAVEKDAVEHALYDAYLESGRIGDILDAMARDVTGAANVGAPEIKDLRRIVENTPPAWWIALLNHMMSDWRAEKSAGRDKSWTYHSRVLATFELGAYISTGCRNEDLCIVSLHLQASDLRKTRRISFRAVDRKNRKAHSVLLQSVYVPDDLLDEYLERSRPFLMREQHLAKGDGAGVTSHEYLLVNAAGESYPLTSTSATASPADMLALDVRVGTHGKSIKFALAAAAVRAGLTLPPLLFDYEFGLHAIRGVCGYGIFVLKGVEAAAHYLGDSLGVTERSYSAIDGKLVDSSALVAVDMSPQLSPVKAIVAPNVTPRVADDYASQLERVLDREERGIITSEEARAARAALLVRNRNAVDGTLSRAS